MLDKYQRRGSNFVTFRVVATNGHGVCVGEYDYTCIFDYARGQRSDAKTPPPEPAAVEPLALDGDAERWTDFDSITLGDRLTGIAIAETQQSIDDKDAFRLVGARGVGSNIHTDAEFARKSIFGATVNSGPATMSYVNQMLDRSFPPGALYAHGRLLLRAITPFRADDTVSFVGEVIGKDELERRVECHFPAI